MSPLLSLPGYLQTALAGPTGQRRVAR